MPEKRAGKCTCGGSYAKPCSECQKPVPIVIHPHPGRPTKLTGEFLDAAKQVIETGDGMNVVYLTDEELLFCINELLPKERQITNRTFETWKAKVFDADDNSREFLRLIKKALTIQKINLFKMMQANKDGWQRFAWILERKFKEWRLPQKWQVGGDPDNPTPIGMIYLPQKKKEGEGYNKIDAA